MRLFKRTGLLCVAFFEGTAFLLIECMHAHNSYILSKQLIVKMGEFRES